MCGISGFIRFKDRAGAEVLQGMTNAIRHRGPDDEGYALVADGRITSYTAEDSVAEAKYNFPYILTAPAASIGMGFRRLSILDLSYCGHQPMLSVDGNIVLTFNGEIYNYKELRKELQQEGVVFKSEGDTEVILEGYRMWGKQVISKLNGMFAIALYDKHVNKLLLVRDRLGIKPLFYHSVAEGITWASEIKAVLKAPWVKPVLNWDGLFANYELQTTPSPSTCFENIFSIEPGTWMEINTATGTIEQNIYWQIPTGQPRLQITGQEAAAQLDEKLQRIVQLQLRSDVPVTSLMSGGIDSTTLTAICAKQHPGFHCYSLGFDGTGEGADELPQAIAMAQQLGIKQHIHYIHAADIIDSLDASIRHFEEPYVMPEPGLEASKYLRHEGYKVVMNGLGADEIFGGYAYYLQYRQWQQRKRLFFLEALIPPAGELLKRTKNYFSLDTTIKYFLNVRLGMKPYDIRDLSSRPFVPLGNKLHDDKAEHLDIPGSLFYYDLKYYIGSHHVYRDDLSGMRHGLEIRYPYLDHELVDWVASLPMHIRHNGTETKPLLRAVAAKYITPTNLSMPKKGFTLPLDKWLKDSGDIQAYARKQLDALGKRGIFDKPTIEKWWQLRDKGIYFSKIWQLVTTEVWLNEYLD